jgi:hypothetical protein
METTRYIGWTITIRIDDTSLGWMPETDDRLASAYRYLELAALDLERQYPGAEVKAEYGPFTRSVDVDGPDNSFETSERAEVVRRDVEYLTARVFEAGGWDVARADA